MDSIFSFVGIFTTNEKNISISVYSVSQGGCPRIAPGVIPAKAGIYKCLKTLDSRLRGNDKNGAKMYSRTAS